MNLEDIKACFNTRKKEIIDDWYQFLRFRSISTNPEYNQDCINCAEWLSLYLREHGLSSEVIRSKGKPLVFAETRGGANEQTALFYGHYDVQPVDPIDLWESDPFEPVERNGRVYARGAQDNKGQAFAFISAVLALKELNRLKLNVKILIEGEEECGSHSIGEMLGSLKEKLGADFLMVSDSITSSLDVTTITMGLRGVIHLEIKLRGSSRDLHSGIHGGVAPNPATALARLLSSLHYENGRIAVEGYYDGIDGPSSEELRLASASDIDPRAYQNSVGVLPCGGEKGLSLMNRRGFQPTVEINGITAGYQGEGQKTIIPSWASAKITSRIAGRQDPERCLELLKSHMRKFKPEGLELEIYGDGVGGGAVFVSSESPVFRKAKKILKQLNGNEPQCIWEGASIPVIPLLSKVSGATPLLVGFGLEEDNIHAPNESFSLAQFRQCFLYTGLVLSEWN
ncbi:MAG: M20 family dipeptidase [SAR324 cluster bacterium]|uniref:M20 family dipeptidase n=1 Tax=SAR324 cluster bacterium TaxID=2024889 RepID=A0A7X9FSS3_9DELT|nr:M20 family dipeptidase [SAR324 cluster bacterium]